VSGSGFTKTSTVLIGGNPIPTTYVNGNSLTAEVPTSDIAMAAQLNVQVVTPAPGGGTSNYGTIEVNTP
jgi:hypothetical protein